MLKTLETLEKEFAEQLAVYKKYDKEAAAIEQKMKAGTASQEEIGNLSALGHELMKFAKRLGYLESKIDHAKESYLNLNSGGRKNIMSLIKAQDGVCKLVFETEFAVQEWGIKNEMRLFGITIAEYGKTESKMKPRAKAYFTDTEFKNMMIIYFDIKETGNKVTVSKSKDMGNGTKWPIKVTRTKSFTNDNIDPVCPLYWVLIDREIILPFKSTMKNKAWQALPFEDSSDIKPINLFEAVDQQAG